MRLLLAHEEKRAVSNGHKNMKADNKPHPQIELKSSEQHQSQFHQYHTDVQEKEHKKDRVTHLINCLVSGAECNPCYSQDHKSEVPPANGSHGIGGYCKKVAQKVRNQQECQSEAEAS